MNEPSGSLSLSPGVIVTLLVCGLVGGLLLAAGPTDYPDLHILLDTGMFLPSAMLALLFWDMGMRVSRLFPKLLAISFAVTCLLEFLHAMVGVEWSGPLAFINQTAHILRPATWPPPAYLLPIAVGGSIWLMRRKEQRTLAFAAVLFLLGLGLLVGFHWLPRYVAPGLLGISRPALILVPLLWLIVGSAGWRLRATDRMLPPLTLMAMVLLAGHVSMLYSRAPHDTLAMVAHLGKVGAYLVLLLSLMQMASSDMLERIRAERELARMNETLERRVLARTAQLESANKALEAEIAMRGQTEQALRESHARTRAIFDTALDGIITMDHEGRVVEFNAASERIFGYRPSQVIGQKLADVIVPPSLREAHGHGLARYLSTGEARVLGKRIEVNGQRADGALVDLELSINRMPGDGLPMFAGFLRDLTERKQAEQALHRSQRLLQAVADNLTATLWVKDLEGRYLLLNGSYEKLFDLRREDIIGKTDYDLFPKEQADIFHAVDREALAAGTAVQAEEAAFYGDTPVTLLSTKCALVDDVGKPYALCGISTDITDRKLAEEALRESQARYQTLAEALPHLVWTCNPDGWCDYLSSQWVEYTGRSEQEQLGYGWAEQLHPDDRERTQAAWTAATVRGDRFDVEFRIRRADGVYRWFKTRAVPLRDATGRIVKWFGSNTDFEDYKQAERKLETQLERLNLLDQITRAIGERQDLKSIFQVAIRSLEEELPVDFSCVCLYDQPGHALLVTSVGIRSEALAMELAMTEQARVAIDENGLSRCVRGQLVYEPDISQVAFPFPQRLVQGGLRSLLIAPLLAESRVFGVLVAARRAPHSFSSSECEFLRQLSEHVALAAHQAQLYGALQQAYDDLRQSQQAVMQQERLGALGQMASGIAHDINNAISPIALYTESLLEKEPNLSARARDYLQTIQRAIEDVAQTVARMREFYRQREPQLTVAPVQLNHLVQQVLDLTRARWSDMPQQRGIVIQMMTDLAADLPAVLGVESEIREALINLVFNAVDAMPEGGSLTVRTKAAERASDLEEGSAWRQVHVEVVDSGVGMDEDTRRRCLEPFFTTKGERGTGLGLAMVYGMVQRHSARIEVESAVSRGTIMRLSFAVATVMSESPRPTPAYAVPTRLRILVVDDDPVLLKSLRDTLELEGHVVVTASGGQAGIDAFRTGQARSEPFAVVITDLGMPYVDGRKVVSAVKQASPSTPVILLTGWGERLIANGDVPPQVDRVLSKPPKLRELREAFARCCAPERS